MKKIPYKKIIKIFKAISPYAFLLTSVYIFMLLSPMSPFGSQAPLIDSSGFQYVGSALSKGLVPYVDVFDHKGLLLYFIEAIPFLIGGSYTLWFIELLFMFSYSVVVYKTSNLFSKKRWISVLVAITNVFSLSIFFEEGNFTEEYSLLFIALALYIFLKKELKNQLINGKDSLLIGLCAGAVLWLRPNMISVWIALVLVIVIYGIVKKNFKYIFKNALFFTLGIVVFSIPLLAYLYYNKALEAAYNAYIVFNFEYTSEALAESIKALIYYWVKEYRLIAFSLVTSLVMITSKNEYRKAGILNSIFCITTIYLCSISGRTYGHYGMILVPCTIIPMAAFLGYIVNNFSTFNKKSKIVNFLIVIAICFVLISEELKRMDIYIPYEVDLEPSTYNWDPYKTSDYIKANTTENDRILCWGNNSIMYLFADRLASSKYFFQDPLFEVNEDMKEEFMNTFDDNMPKMIVLTQQYETEYQYKTLLISEKLDNYYRKVEIPYASNVLYELKEVEYDK